jgi:hypothetical protein
MKNAPVGYECPFCHIAETLPASAPESAVVLVQPNVFAFVPLHHYAGIRGNCLIAPRRHYENVLEIPDELGIDLASSSFAQLVAWRRQCNKPSNVKASLRGSTTDQRETRTSGTSIFTCFPAIPTMASTRAKRCFTKRRSASTQPSGSGLLCASARLLAVRTGTLQHST